jgi:hypothetical protein
MYSIAVGCSHTVGVGVEPHEAWPNLLGAVNLGVGGCSADYIARNMPKYLTKYNPNLIYVLWPDWTRFEYFDQGQYYQSLPTDPNRIYFMETATDGWLQNNYIKQISLAREICKNIKLIEMTLYDLIPFIDHTDRWPVSKLGHHYSEVWHTWVADIFETKAEWIQNHRLFA